MGEGTGISWATDTVNFWAGCTKVSEACAHCYAERDTARRGFVKWGPGAPRRLVKNARPNALRWNAEAERTGVDRRVFAMSWADWLDHEVAPEWLADFLMLIEETPSLTWLLLSKRLEGWRERLIDACRASPALDQSTTMARRWIEGEPPHNVWLGTTVENQERADERIPLLLDTPARLRFLSMEPLLGRVDGADILIHGAHGDGIRWVITGGESGAGWRPMDLDHVREIRDACADMAIPFHHKQHAGLHPKELGRELDGVVHDAVPPLERHAIHQRRLACSGR